jgi:hypothetical protein
MNDRNSRPIILALLAVLVFTALALVASVVIPFDVEQPATVQSVSGEVELRAPDEIAVRLNPASKTTLEVGQNLDALPNSEARITFDLNQGRAILTGPATLALIESYRRATALGHTSDQFEREYVLTLEQTQGSVRYIFANTDPPFEDTHIIVRLPDGSYTPSAPCWRIDIPVGAGESIIETFDCEPPG